MDDIKLTLQKIKALADGTSNEHERASAFKMLDKLMTKYGVSEADFNDDAITDYSFKYRTERERRLLIQIIFKVLGRQEFNTYSYRRNGKKLKEFGVDCTVAQKIEIELYFDFYKKLYKHEESMFFTAFVNKHELYRPSDDNNDVENKLTEEDTATLFAYMNGMSKETPYRQLEDKHQNPQEKN